MEKKWTKEQTKAIELRHRNLLVAAAAGSGKTAVLVERILQRVLDEEEPLDIDRLLVVTFTKAAAAEMKDRLRDALLKKSEEQPDNVHLKRQMILLHYADITTIDSFCLQVVQSYCQELDLDPSFRIGDEGELKLLFSDTMEAFLEEQYEKGEESFFSFGEAYAAGKNDHVIEECIGQLYRFSQSYPWPEEWFSACQKSFEVEKEEGLLKEEWLLFLEERIRLTALELSAMTREALKAASEEGGPYMYEPALNSDLSVQTDIACAEDFPEMCRILASYNPERLSSKKDKTVNDGLRGQVKAVRDYGKKLLQDMKKEYGSFSLEEVLGSIRALKEPMQAVLSLAQAFGQRYYEAKREKNILDFSDVEHLALSVLVKRQEGVNVPSPAALELSGRYEEIMADEYQDESRLQEEILTAVSREREGRPNLFMVGDVKQSIYKFRLARPELFMEKYESYKTEDGLYQKIDLHKNFRSRKETLAWINRQFFQTMKKSLGGVEYDEAAALNPGAEYPEGEGYEPELLLMDIGEEKEEITSEEASLLEARMIAGKIKELTKPDTGLFIRGEDGNLRTAGYGDIVILLRSGAGKAEGLLNTLLAAGIPARAQTKTGYFSAWEVQIALNWLRILDNPCQDIPLASVLHSPSVGFSSEELAKIAAQYDKTEEKQKKPRLYHALLSYEGEERLQRKTEGFLILLKELRGLSYRLSIHQLLQAIFEKTGFYDQVSVMPGGRVRKGNLDMLLEKAVAYENISYHGLFQFVRYIDRLEKYQVDFQEAPEGSQHENQVQIMTIHASKGLEFPIVFVAGLHKKFNDTDSRRQILLHPDWGISADFVDPHSRVRKKTLLRKAYGKKGKTDSMGEELRVLYVALTRAREKLILTGVVKDAEKRKEKWSGIELLEERGIPVSYLLSAACYLDWILMGDCREGENRLRISCRFPREFMETAVLEKIKEHVDKDRLEHWQEPVLEEVRKDLQERLSFVYPYQEETGLHTKLSVSELKKKWMEEETEGEEALPVLEPEETEPSLPAFLKEAEPLKGASLGTAYHRILELWDFKRDMDIEEIQAEIQNLVKRGGMEAGDGECIRAKTLYCFLKSPIGKRMARAERNGRLFREKQFVMGLPAKEIQPETSTEELIVVQGIIDAWIEEEDGLVIVDYKTDRVPFEGGEKVLKERYAAQLQYYKKALSRITGKSVKECVIYSLYLGREIVL